MVTAVGADVGGTFTDFVVVEAGGVRSFKVATTEPQSQGILNGLERIEAETLLFVHGTTVATNALLEESGARVAFVTTPGFEDLVEIARQRRPSLYDMSIDRPNHLVERDHRIGHMNLEETLKRLTQLHPDAVAVGMIDSYRDSAEEDDVAVAIEEEFPELTVSLSQVVSPGFREYERFATTILDAYLSPVVAAYLEELEEELPVSQTFVMTSSGGLLPLRSAMKRVGQLTLSGPAGGVVATDALRRYHALESVISFDMGGTSTDVARIGPDGVRLALDQEIGGRINRVPSMPVHTVGAGGGSIAWIDPGGALRVGPHSAGANPGPACYGLGGVEPTVTDANVHLGYIEDSSSFSSDIFLNRALASAAIERLAESLGLTPDEAGLGILAVADAHIEGAIRKVSIEEGFDPRSSSLVAFGGAGGLHATRLARRMEMRSVLVPPHPGAFSALGLMMAALRIEILQTFLKSTTSPEASPMADAVSAAAQQEFVEVFGTSPDRVDVLVDARYVGQSYELTVPFRAEGTAEGFESEHESRFGFRLEGGEIEIVNVRAVATGPPPLVWGDIAGQSLVATKAGQDRPRPDLDKTEKAVIARNSLYPGDRVSGPCLISDDTGSILMGVGETACVLSDGTLEITW
jgi:N-methylhydantoinase A